MISTGGGGSPYPPVLRNAEVRTYRRQLPHGRVDGAVYFVTWRLRRDQPALLESERTPVVAALKFFDQQRYSLYAYVVMDDHVHLVVQPFEGFALEQIIKSWKGYTATVLRKASRRPASLWQTEYYDRVIRDQRELKEKVQYLLDNPFRRWDTITAYEWAGLGDGLS
ncbi:MAG: REP-associated tyrosine transposase [Chloroflexota bacterium]